MTIQCGTFEPSNANLIECLTQNHSFYDPNSLFLLNPQGLFNGL